MGLFQACMRRRLPEMAAEYLKNALPPSEAGKADLRRYAADAALSFGSAEVIVTIRAKQVVVAHESGGGILGNRRSSSPVVARCAQNPARSLCLL
jgi:hypothetical protein